MDCCHISMHVLKCYHFCHSILLTGLQLICLCSKVQWQPRDCYREIFKGKIVFHMLSNSNLSALDGNGSEGI